MQDDSSINNETDTPKGKPFHRRRELRDRFYLARLPAMSLRVLDVLETYADADGITWVAPQRIASDLLVNVRNVQRALAILASCGLVTAGHAGAGRGHRFKRRIMVPENPAHCAVFRAKLNPAQDGKKTRRTKARKPGAQRQKNPAQCAGRTTQGTTQVKAQTTTQGGSGCPSWLRQWLGEEEGKRAAKRHTEQHLLRCGRLVNVKAKYGETTTPKILMKYFVGLDPEAVDFGPLEADEHEERTRKEIAELGKRRSAAAEENNAWHKQASATLKALNPDISKKYKALYHLLFPSHGDYPIESNISMTLVGAELVDTITEAEMDDTLKRVQTVPESGHGIADRVLQAVKGRQARINAAMEA